MPTRIIEKDFNTLECMTINMGPQHPSTHGVLRLVLELDGEIVVGVKPVMGYLHRAKEKHAEVKTYHQFIPYTDRMDYLSPMSNNAAYVMTVEKALGIDVTDRCKYLRMILCELARISSHLLWMGSTALELGAMTVFVYTFREREKIYDIFEAIAGARFTVSYMRVGGMARDASPEWLARVRAFMDEFPRHMDEYEALLNENEIFIQRMMGIGKITGAEALDMGLAGPCIRASGVDIDLRRDNPYLAYPEVDFRVAVETEGDCLARYLVRVREMHEAHKIVRQCLEKFPSGPVNIDNPKVIYPPRERLVNSMEDLIHHFLLAAEGFSVPPGEVYHAIEAPKGELGFYLVSDGGTKSYRLGVRSPSFNNLQAIDRMCKGHMLADVVAILASLDPVLGDVDR